MQAEKGDVRRIYNYLSLIPILRVSKDLATENRVKENNCICWNFLYCK